jgi:hypothetical protein
MIEGTALAESFGMKELKRDVAVYFATPKVHQPDGMFDGTVGHELFAGHVLSLDFHAHRFWMAEGPPRSFRGRPRKGSHYRSLIADDRLDDSSPTESLVMSSSKRQGKGQIELWSWNNFAQ